MHRLLTDFLGFPFVHSKRENFKIIHKNSLSLNLYINIIINLCINYSMGKRYLSDIRMWPDFGKQTMYAHFIFQEILI